MISWLSGNNKDGFDLTRVIEKIEKLVPLLPDGEAKTTMVATHVLWHEWRHSDHHRPSAAQFIEQYGPCLDLPTPMAFTVGLLSNRRPPAWTPDEWATMASKRHAARAKGKELPLPASIDALIQLEAADHLEATGRHEEAVAFAVYAVEECPGSADLMAWEKRLLSGDHDPHFDVHLFLFGIAAHAGAADAIVTETTEQTQTD